MPNASMIVVVGHATADATAPGKSGKPFTKFGIAVNFGKREDDNALFLDVKCFGLTAEWALKDIYKGAAVTVMGRLDQDKWTNSQDGTPQTRLVVVADSVTVHVRREQDAQAPPPFTPSPAAGSPSMPYPRAAAATPEPDSDDIPF